MSSACPVTIIILVQTREKNAAVASTKSSTASRVGRLLNAADKMKKMTTIFVKWNIFIFQNATAQTISFDDHTTSFIL